MSPWPCCRPQDALWFLGEAAWTLSPGCRGAAPGVPALQPDSLQQPPPPGQVAGRKSPRRVIWGVSLSPRCGVWRRARAGVNAQLGHKDWLLCYSGVSLSFLLLGPGPHSAQLLPNLPWVLAGQCPGVRGGGSSVRGSMILFLPEPCSGFIVQGHFPHCNDWFSSLPPHPTRPHPGV